MSEEILKLIEEVDPADTDKLDQIDARVESFAHPGVTIETDATGAFINRCYARRYKPPQYTRSRDALKSIRLEGWKNWALFDGYKEGAKFRGEMFSPDQNHQDIVIQTDWLPTEELAELHAIIQAIAYEREQKG